MPLPLIVAIAIIFAAVVSFLLGYFYRTPGNQLP